MPGTSNKPLHTVGFDIIPKKKTSDWLFIFAGKEAEKSQHRLNKMERNPNCF